MMNIDYTTSLQQIKQVTDIWCAAGSTKVEGDGGSVSAADAALRIGARAIAADAHAVHMLWAWLENKGVEILAVFQGREVKGLDPEKLSEQIQAVLKKGADGAIIKSTGDLSELTDALLPVKSDLFFGKKLFIALALDNIGPHDWGNIFRQLKKLGADGIVLDARGARTVAGKVFGMLSNWDSGFAGRIMFLADHPVYMEDALRLIEKIKPELIKKLRFFIGARH